MRCRTRVNFSLALPSRFSIYLTTPHAEIIATRPLAALKSSTTLEITTVKPRRRFRFAFRGGQGLRGVGQALGGLGHERLRSDQAHPGARAVARGLRQEGRLARRLHARAGEVGFTPRRTLPTSARSPTPRPSPTTTIKNYHYIIHHRRPPRPSGRLAREIPNSCRQSAAHRL